MKPIEKRFGEKVRSLRKERGWNQQELGSRVDTSGVIIGRYERGEMVPSIKVAEKFAEVFDVTIDHLVTDRKLPEILHDQKMIERWRAIDQLAPDDRERVLFVIDSLIREATTRKAFASTA